MKRVLQIMGGLKRGGLETFAMNMYRSIDRTKIQFDFLLTQVSGGDYEEEAKSLGANIFYLPPRNKGVRAYHKALDTFFKNNHEYIAIHEHISSLTSIDPAYYAMKYGIPVRIFHAHSSAIQKSIRFHWLHTLLHYINKPKVRRYATHYLGCSDKAIDWVYNYTGVRSKAIMINNGIDCEQYSYNDHIRNEVRQEFGINDSDFLIGHVGRFIPLKNQDFLVTILQYIKKSKPSSKLILIGDGETLDAIKKRTIREGLSESVIFTGVRSDVARLMQAMDVFVMPSWFEGLPVSLIEAQAAGLPIVASDTISHDSDVTGIIHFKSLNDSAEEWANTIIEWAEELQRPDRLDKIKSAGFDSKTTVKQLENIYTGHDK